MKKITTQCPWFVSVLLVISYITCWCPLGSLWKKSAPKYPTNVIIWLRHCPISANAINCVLSYLSKISKIVWMILSIRSKKYIHKNSSAMCFMFNLLYTVNVFICQRSNPSRLNICCWWWMGWKKGGNVLWQNRKYIRIIWNGSNVSAHCQPQATPSNNICNLRMVYPIPILSATEQEFIFL